MSHYRGKIPVKFKLRLATRNWYGLPRFPGEKDGLGKSDIRKAIAKAQELRRVR